MILETVRRCKHCNLDVTDSIDARSFLSNPFCSNCVNDRLERANAAMGATTWVEVGHYVKLVPVIEKTGEDA